MLPENSEPADTSGDTADEREVSSEENETILANNKYLVDDPRFKPRYDATDILISGNIPALKDDAERFVCANEVGKFILNNGVNGAEENIAKLFSAFSAVHILVLCQILNAEQIGKLVVHPATKEYVKSAIE